MRWRIKSSIGVRIFSCLGALSGGLHYKILGELGQYTEKACIKPDNMRFRARGVAFDRNAAYFVCGA